MAGMLMLAMISYAGFHFIDNIFYSQVEARYRAENELASFLGVFWAAGVLTTTLSTPGVCLPWLCCVTRRTLAHDESLNQCCVNDASMLASYTRPRPTNRTMPIVSQAKQTEVRRRLTMI